PRALHSFPTRRSSDLGELSNPTCSAQGHNPLCGDQLRLFLVMDSDTIKDISFTGSGCCISKASASLLTESVKGHNKTDVQQMFRSEGHTSELQSLAYL